MANVDKPKVTQLPYMGPPKDDAKEKEHKRVSNTVPATTGTKLVVPLSPDYRDRNYAKGGTASSRADGIAQRGKTKGKMVMCGGGMAKGKK